jgi:hypothetical protein
VDITNGNVFPFGGTGGLSFPGTTYQQVYLGSLFGSSQIRLTAVEFFVSPNNGTRQVVAANYALSLSTTAKPVDGLDTVNLAMNVGADQQMAFNGPLGPGSIADSRLHLAFSNPVTFTPTNGNLLLQVVRTNPGPNTSAAFLAHIPNDGFPPGLSSRASDFGSNNVTNIFLVTRFHQQRCECPPQSPCTC